MHILAFDIFVLHGKSGALVEPLSCAARGPLAGSPAALHIPFGPKTSKMKFGVVWRRKTLPESVPKAPKMVKMKLGAANGGCRMTPGAVWRHKTLLQIVLQHVKIAKMVNMNKMRLGAAKMKSGVVWRRKTLLKAVVKGLQNEFK